MSIIIGIDPGSRMTGYGVIQQVGDKLHFLDAGTIQTNSTEMPIRLKQIFLGVDRVVKHYQKYGHDDIQAAVEQIFMAQNPDSALKLGQARGGAIAALVSNELEVSEYTARQIKQAVCGYGAADKSQVQDMVCRILSLQITPQNDAADGLACAICHAHSSHSMNKLLRTANAKSKSRGRTVSRKQGRWRLTEDDLASRSHDK